MAKTLFEGQVKQHLQKVKKERARMADSIVDLLVENALLRSENRHLRSILGLEEDAPWLEQGRATDGAGSSAGS